MPGQRLVTPFHLRVRLPIIIPPPRFQILVVFELLVEDDHVEGIGDCITVVTTAKQCRTIADL